MTTDLSQPANQDEWVPVVIDTTREARDTWPQYDALYFDGQGFRNGRELGQWIAGYLHSHWMTLGDPGVTPKGLRVGIREGLLDGVFGVLGRAGVVALRTEFNGPSASDDDVVQLDVWIQQQFES